jgi:histone-lysine N-methyltransferase EZH2
MSRVHWIEELWQERVGEEVEKIRFQNMSNNQENISKAWIDNRSKMTSLKGQKDERLVSWQEMPQTYCVEGKREIAAVWAEILEMHYNSRIKQEVEIVMMPACVQPPTMVTWVPIERNILVENGQISSIPYFGDDVIDRNPKFISSLVQEVNKVRIIENLTDELFLPLVSALSVYSGNVVGKTKTKYAVLYKPDSAREHEWIEVSKSDASLPGLIVFQAIASKYPQFGTADELIAKYRGLTSQTANPDIDGINTKSMSAERALHSHKSLLCRRCFLYNCPLHIDPKVDEPVPKVQGREELILPTTTCGIDCFQHLTGALTDLSGHTPARATVSQSGGHVVRTELCDELNQMWGFTGTGSDVWTGAEETFCRVLEQTFPSNWCVIAQSMVTKKCRQVYEFSLQDCGTKVSSSKSLSTNVGKQQKVKSKTMEAALYKCPSEGSQQTYSPCHHPGQQCSEEVCSCIQVGNFCEKYCYCPIDCSHRFPGCKCRKQCTTKSCFCYRASRECDPDLCTTCLDSSLGMDTKNSSCRNVVLQRRMGKKLYVAPSDIAGWGCYMGEMAAKNEFITEYVGEMISQEETERRGKIYKKAKCSYMFGLNEDYCIDAARMGGNIRFANHSSKPNCKVKIVMVAGDHRIGIYADKNIEIGEELTYDYGPNFNGRIFDVVIDLYLKLFYQQFSVGINTSKL